MAFNKPPASTYTGTASRFASTPGGDLSPSASTASMFYSVAGPSIGGSGSPIASSPPAGSWNPAPEELAYYDHLFHLADVSNTQSIKGREAVSFFSKSALPVTSLKQIWALSDRRNEAELNRSDFAYACRLIALAQAGIAIAPGAVEANAHVSVLPKFEGVDLPTPKPAPVIITPSAEKASSPSSADPWVVTADDRAKYAALFSSIDADADGFITGAEAVALFKKSGLPREVLSAIWGLSDVDKDGNLDLDEFCIAFHIILKVSKGGLAMPEAVPASLVPASKRALLGLPASSATPAAALPPPVAPAPLPPVMETVLPVLTVKAPVTAPSGIGSLSVTGMDAMDMMFSPPSPVLKAMPLDYLGAPASAILAPAGADYKSTSSASGRASPVIPSSFMPPTAPAANVVKPVAVGAFGSASGRSGTEDLKSLVAVSKAHDDFSATLPNDLDALVSSATATNTTLKNHVASMTDSLERQRKARGKALAQLGELQAEKEVLLSELHDKDEAFKEEFTKAEDIEAGMEELRERIAELRSKKVFQIEMVSEEREKVAGKLAEKRSLEIEAASLQREIESLQAEKERIQALIYSSSLEEASYESGTGELEAIRAAHLAGAAANDRETSMARAVIVKKSKALEGMKAQVSSLTSTAAQHKEKAERSKAAYDKAQAAAIEAANLHEASLTAKETTRSELEAISKSLTTAAHAGSATTVSLEIKTRSIAVDPIVTAKSPSVIAAPPVAVSSFSAMSNPAFSDDEGEEKDGPSAFAMADLKGTTPASSAFGDVTSAEGFDGFDADVGDVSGGFESFPASSPAAADGDFFGTSSPSAAVDAFSAFTVSSTEPTSDPFGASFGVESPAVADAFSTDDFSFPSAATDKETSRGGFGSFDFGAPASDVSFDGGFDGFK